MNTLRQYISCSADDEPCVLDNYAAFSNSSERMNAFETLIVSALRARKKKSNTIITILYLEQVIIKETMGEPGFISTF